MKLNSKKVTSIALALTALNSTYASAEALEFDKLIDLGTLTIDNSGSSFVRAIAFDGRMVSADGRVVVGWSNIDGSGFLHAFRHSEGNGKMTDLGTLNDDNSGHSRAFAVSADGRVVVGQAQLDNSIYGVTFSQAFRHNEGDVRITGLGTLRSDNQGFSSAYAVSADGRVVVGQADTDSGIPQAFRHNEGDVKMTGLGAFRSDGYGNSVAFAVSADGRVVAGGAETDYGEMHAFRYTEGDVKMIDLGTLRSDNRGYSFAYTISADGRVVVGDAQTESGEMHAFRHNKGDTKITDLGTLKSDNSGRSNARTVSLDGRVVVGGAETASGEIHAFRHTEGDVKMTDLGTLRSDNSGASEAKAVSADGRVVAGDAQTEIGEMHAFRHSKGDVKITDLGTLRSDNKGYSSAYAISADGSVVAGDTETDSGDIRAFVYKTKMIDLIDNSEMLHKGAEQQTAALSFLQDKLTDALFQGCRPDAGNTCFSAGAKYYQQSNNEVNDTAAYVNIAHRFQPKVYAGIYLEQSVSSGFANTIDASNEQPLVAVYGGFSPSGNNLGLQIRAAAATHKINADITRPNLTSTEAGKGSTNFKGYSGQLEAAYALQATEKMIVSPVIGIRYSQVERGAYTESSTSDFPYQYEKMESKQASLFAGIQTEISLSNKVNMYANAGIEQVLDHSEEAFSAKASYLGGLSYNNPDVRHTRAYAATGVSYEVAPNQKIGLGIGYRQANFKSSRDGLSANLGYTIQF